MKRASILLVVLLIAGLSVGSWFVVQAGENAVKAQEKQTVSTKPEPEKKATLTVQPGSNNSVGIDLTNSVPVRGVQFTVSGMKMTEIRTTERTEGFLAKFNEETGIVILVSTAADEIPPGKGAVLKLFGDKVKGTDVSLTSIMIADTNRKLVN